MTTIQWRPQVNALTKPQSYRPQVVPRETAGYEEMAADIAAAHPNYNADLVRSLAPLMMDWIQQRMINGWQVTFKDAFTFHPSLTGRMARPDDPLPDDEELLEINVYASRPFVQAVRQQAQLERLPASKKLPLITAAEDMVLKLNDVLNPNGALHLSGSALLFDPADEDCGCVLEGTRSGRQKQTRCTAVFNSEITLLPDIPPQDDPWNNEYILSISTQYTEHGTVRTGIYERRLRAPLTVHGLTTWTGILTGKESSAHVSVTGGSMSADTVLRIQAVLDLQNERMLLSLLDMREGGGAQGAEVSVTQNGAYILPGFAGSPVSSMEVTVQNYAALWEMIRNDYGGRLVDVLDVRQGS